ncbi:hypothetical protein J4H86_23710 [Spiractinospora alimapuensis]|uniref:hypothetical protein n=1 Tax=Spiractinospora alimapuensis TaxID=2820884 RepID=UPI001F3C14FD|nr:hypothetical protein [Spiractinospora alimapuensis]QVQ51740.1 hypothetical protein J4H86_23710 [Spiractinospora alimapuensis]
MSPHSPAPVVVPPDDPLGSLSAALKERGLHTRVDRPYGVVDARIPDFVALAGCYGRGKQRIGLRPVPITGELWWYLFWPAEHFETHIVPFEMEKLRPAGDVTEVARLVRQVLVLFEREEW